MAAPTVPTVPNLTPVHNTPSLNPLPANLRQANALLFAKELVLAKQIKSDSTSTQSSTLVSNNHHRPSVFAPASLGLATNPNTTSAGSPKASAGKSAKRKKSSGVSHKR